MKVGEQIDALELLGVSPIQRAGRAARAGVRARDASLHVLIAATAIASGFVAESAAVGPRPSDTRPLS